MIAETGQTRKHNFQKINLYYRWRTAGPGEKNPNTGKDITGRIVRETF